jgi:hypothetical protein
MWGSLEPQGGESELNERCFVCLFDAHITGKNPYSRSHAGAWPAQITYHRNCGNDLSTSPNGEPADSIEASLCAAAFFLEPARPYGLNSPYWVCMKDGYRVSIFQRQTQWNQAVAQSKRRQKGYRTGFRGTYRDEK